MTITVDDQLARLAAVLERLERLGLTALVEPAPLAAGDLPPHVASGELIESAWGNAVVDELARQRGEQINAFTHAGGTTGGGAIGIYDCGTTTLGPFTYPVRVSVWASISFGFNGSGPATASADIVRLSDGSNMPATPQGWAAASQWETVPNLQTWIVTAGLGAGFRTRVNVTANGAGGGCWYAAAGLYHVQRYST